MAKKKAKKAVKKKSAPKKKAAKKSARGGAKKATKKTAKKKPARKASKKAAPKATAPRQTSINPYLNFPGNCEDAFNFYKNVFGGNFTYLGRFGEMPPQEGTPPMPENERNKIMHVSLPIGGGSILMGSDASEAFGHNTNVGNNFSISINAKSQSDADRLYNGLSEGGMQTMPMSKTFWGSYYGMLTDKYGIQWMVSFDENGPM